MFIVDIDTPRGCAFSRDESVVAWTHAGGVTFADTTTGALVGRLVIATSGREYAVCDTSRFDWTGAPKKPISNEVVPLVAGTPLAGAALRGQRSEGLLAELTR